MPSTKAQLWLQDRGFLGREGETLYPSEMPKSLDLFKLRDEFIQQFGFAILDERTVTQLSSLIGNSKVLEIGAGSGYWSYELRRFGIDAVATDPQLTRYATGGWELQYVEVDKLDGIAALDKYGHDLTLMMVWPDYESTWSSDVLSAYEGDQAIICGEDRYGCTGCAGLFDQLESEWQSVRSVFNPTWPYVHDYIEVFKRR